MAVDLSPALQAFLGERHLATLVTLRADGSPHAVPVGFTWRIDDGSVRLRVITVDGSVKVRNARRGGRASIMQLDGARWATFEGVVQVLDDHATVAGAEAAYAARYRPPKDRSDRVVIELEVDRVLCSTSLR